MYENNTTLMPVDIRHDKYLKPKLSKIGKIFLLILLIVIFEGAFRKWISSSLTNPIILFRDVIVIYGIYFSIKSGEVKVTQFGIKILLFWTALLFIWGLLQLIINQTSILIFIVGTRFWLLYLWFAYVAAVSLNKYDFDFIAKVIVIVLLAMTPLTVMQHFLPPGAFLNKQVDGDESTVFRVTADIVRTTGTFSFTSGYSTLLAMSTPFILAFLVPGTKLWNKKWMPKICVLVLAIATMVSGSRSAIVFFGVLFCIFVVIILLYSKRSKKGSAIGMILIVSLLLGLTPYFFSRSIDANLERFESASQGEDIYDRIISIFFGEPGIYKNFPLIGNGLGGGTNFAGVVATGERTFLLAETEAARIILEGGLLGFVFIGLKLLVIVSGLRKSVFIAKIYGNILPLLLWVTTGLALLSWSIIGQLTVNALGYLLLGLAIASLRLFFRKL